MKNDNIQHHNPPIARIRPPVVHVRELKPVWSKCATDPKKATPEHITTVAPKGSQC